MEWVSLWILNTFSESQFLHDDDDEDYKAVAISRVFSENSPANNSILSKTASCATVDSLFFHPENFIDLTVFQRTDFKLFKAGRVCRRQF